VTAPIVAICAAVYLGMILGALPFLQLDCTGIALLGAIALVGTGALTPEQAARAIHLPTLLLLFSFMVIAAPTPVPAAASILPLSCLRWRAAPMSGRLQH